MSTDVGFFGRVLEVLRRGEAEDIARQTRVGGDLTGIVGNAQIGVGTVGSAEIADRGVGAAEVDWSQMLPVRLAAWLNTDQDEGSPYGWGLPSSGSYTQYLTSINIVPLPDCFPPKAGYTRQYRLTAQFAHVVAAGETAYRFLVQAALSGITINFYNGAPATADFTATSGWVTNAYFDSASIPVREFLQGRAEYAVAVGTGRMRAAVLEGRYVV